MCPLLRRDMIKCRNRVGDLSRDFPVRIDAALQRRHVIGTSQHPAHVSRTLDQKFPPADASVPDTEDIVDHDERGLGEFISSGCRP